MSINLPPKTLYSKIMTCTFGDSVDKKKPDADNMEPNMATFLVPSFDISMLVTGPKINKRYEHCMCALQWYGYTCSDCIFVTDFARFFIIYYFCSIWDSDHQP